MAHGFEIGLAKQRVNSQPHVKRRPTQIDTPENTCVLRMQRDSDATGIAALRHVA